MTTTTANQITVPNVGGPRQLPNRTSLAARVGELGPSALPNGQEH